MKKIVFALLAVVVLLSCGGASSQEKNEVRELLTNTFKEVDEELSGEVIDEATICDSVRFKKDRIYYYYSTKEALIPVSQIKEEKATRKANIKKMLESTPDMAFLINMLIKIDGGINYVYVGDTTGDVCEIKVDF